MSYTELEKQPFWWVEKMTEYLNIKYTQEEIESKKAQRKSKTPRINRR
jgi:hypothetical protein